MTREDDTSRSGISLCARRFRRRGGTDPTSSPDQRRPVVPALVSVLLLADFGFVSVGTPTLVRSGELIVE